MLPAVDGFRNLTLESPVPSQQSFLSNGSFRFLNTENPNANKINWEAPRRTMLWRYNLHYFDYLRQKSLEPAAATRLLSDWTINVEPFRSVAWQPYPTSLRLVNWLFFLCYHDMEAESGTEKIQKSYLLQAAWLNKNLEYHIQANHLFENIKALVFAGAYFEGEFGDSLLKKSQKLLRQELAEQFLPDGFHYEKTPMYHSIMVCGLLDLLNLMKNNSSLFESALIDELEDKAIKALDALSTIVPPDQSVPFFNDSANGTAPAYADLIDYSSRTIGYTPAIPQTTLTQQVLEDAGYYVARLDQNMLIMDCGDIGPAHQPGHTHCDMLSYELWLDGVKVITNCGNFDYENGPQRHYSRSTAAHNTVELDGQDQSEIWGAFRVGRRARVTESHAEKTGDSVYFRGAHDGYRYLRGKPIHRREIELDEDANLKVTDEILGTGDHMARSFIHFVQNFSVQSEANLFVIRNPSGDAVLELIPDGMVSAEIIETERFPEFGIKQKGVSIVLSLQAPAPFSFGYRLRKIVH